MKTTRCLFALGLSVSLAAACGDDDTITGNGGSGGRAGGGAGGRAGSGGAAGSAGAAGTGGSSAGTGGSSAGTGGSSAGTGGSSAGTGGSSAGTGGVGPLDAGADGGEVTDAGPEPIACPPDLVEATAAATTANDTQEVIITRLVFVGGDALGCTDEVNGCIQVTFRAIADSFSFIAPLQLCTGSQLVGDCDDGVQLLDASGDGDASTALNAGEEITYTTGLGEIATAASGEIALVNGEPAADTDPIIRAYINWGDYVSLPATVGPNSGESLEEAAAEEGLVGVWLEGDSVEVNGQTTIYADADVTDENGFSVCTQ
jgi:hypothetical protein